MAKNNILFVTEKWCDGTPDLGLTNNFHNLFNTFSQSQGDKYNWNTIHLDEAAIVFGVHIDNILPRYCIKWGIKAIVFSLLGQSSFNPSFQCYKELKNLGIYLCFMWPDCGPGWGVGTIQALGDIADLNVVWDNPHSQFHYSMEKPKNWLSLWVPQDSSMFFNDLKTTPVSFIGSDRYMDRAVFLQYARKELPEVEHLGRGGQREEKLSPESYAKFIRQSKIGINFALSPAQFWQTKGRIFEILASCSMLMESKNPSTESLLEAGKDYVDFCTPKEMVEKIKYYIEHDDERIKIAEQGHKTFLSKYTAKIFWDTIVERIKKVNHP